jgi:hypothetical protein
MTKKKTNLKTSLNGGGLGMGGVGGGGWGGFKDKFFGKEYVGERIFAWILMMIIAILLFVWMSFFQQTVGTYKTYFPPGFCDTNTTLATPLCINIYGKAGVLYDDWRDLNRWVFIIFGSNILFVLSGALIGSNGKLGNSVSIILSVLGFAINGGLILFISIYYLPYYNKVGSVWNGNMFNDLRMCCVSDFYNNHKSMCPNGKFNYAIPVSCASPNNLLDITSLVINSDGLFFYILLFVNMICFVALAADGYWCLEDYGDVIKKALNLTSKMKNIFSDTIEIINND